MLEDFLEKTEFTDYNDFFANYKIKVPENFNFGYDVVDVLAQRTPDATAFIWCNDNDEELRMTFGELKERTDKASWLARLYRRLPQRKRSCFGRVPRSQTRRNQQERRHPPCILYIWNTKPSKACFS